MVKPKTKPCATCQTPNSLYRRTCVQCMSSLPKKGMAEKKKKMKDTNWAASVKANRNSSRNVRIAEFSVFKLDSLGYRPILFIAHRGRKGQIVGDMVHHIPTEDEEVKEIILKMRRLYEDLLRKLPVLQPPGAGAPEPGAEPVLPVESAQSTMDLPPPRMDEFIRGFFPVSLPHPSPRTLSSTEPPSSSLRLPSSTGSVPQASSRKRKRETTQDVQIKEEPDEEECRISLGLDGQEPPLIKSEEEDNVQVEKEEAAQFSLTSVDVKSEDDEATSSSTQHMTTETHGDNCAEAEAADALDTNVHTHHKRGGKAKTKLCATCQSPNTLCRRTCVQCMSSLPVTGMAEKTKQMKETNWAASVKANRNSSRTVKTAELSVFKLDSLGYRPILFIAHRGRKGQIVGDMVHHIPTEDEEVKEIVLKMRRLYEDLLRKLPVLQPPGACAPEPGADPQSTVDLPPTQEEGFIQNHVPLSFHHPSPPNVSSFSFSFL
ncbi:uncharacterized protein ACB058_002233 [Synchiropus picturatus]